MQNYVHTQLHNSTIPSWKYHALQQCYMIKTLQLQYMNTDKKLMRDEVPEDNNILVCYLSRV